jgi:tetraacyldisaccharide 4'-kinase
MAAAIAVGRRRRLAGGIRRRRQIAGPVAAASASVHNPRMPAPAPAIHDLLSGRRGGLSSLLARSALRLAEPFYRALVIGRNRLYDIGILRAHELPVPVVSVGNITAGGTGKTPIVQWLAAELRSRGMHPAILMRGYARNAISDEQDLLREALSAGDWPVPVHADPDRVAGAARMLREHARVDLFILDDGFQHRRLRRRFDLVLIDATSPFGYGHVHPRGLLREPVGGLARADAFIITRSDLASPEQCRSIERTLRANNRVAPIYRARHAITGLRTPDRSAAQPPDIPLEQLAGRRFFAFAGIANPMGLELQLGQLPGQCAGHQWFADHHDYSSDEVAALRARARDLAADLLVVTEKDWRKLRRLEGLDDPRLPLWRLALDVQLIARSGQGLLDLVQAQIGCP